MVVKVSKPEINVREKISELDKPSGTAGQAMLAAETPQEQFNLISAGRRNLIFNGDMRIAQRSSGLFTNPNGHFPVDRFAVGNYIPSTTSQQSTTAPSGYSNSLKVTNGTATVPSNQFFTYQVYQFIEGFNTTHLVFGSSSAKTVTLSFWVRSSITGTFAVTLQNSARDRSYISTYTINQADTFEKKTITVNGDVAGTWVGATNGIGLRLIFDIGSGTNRETTAGAWQSGNYTRTSDSARINTTTSATFYVTGVQLEVGKVATPFEHRSYGEELALCERYYQKLGGTAYQALGFGKIYAAGQSAFAYVGFNTKMRASPSVTEGGNGLIVTDRVAYDDTVTSLSGVAAGQGSLYATFHTGVTRSDRHPVIIACKNGASGWLNLDAEI